MLLKKKSNVKTVKCTINALTLRGAKKKVLFRIKPASCWFTQTVLVKITTLYDRPFIPRSNSQAVTSTLGWLTRLSVQNNSAFVCQASCKQIFLSGTAWLYQKQKSIMNSEKSHSWNAENIILVQELPISACPVGLLKHTLDMKGNLL